MAELDELLRRGVVSQGAVERQSQNARDQMGYRTPPPMGIEDQDRLNATRTAFAAGRYYKDERGSYQILPFASNVKEATKDLNLNEQEQNLYNHHLQNLAGSGKVTNQDGSISTVYQTVVPGPGGKFYNIPTVRNGQILPVPQAAQAAAADGWDKWPSYSSPEEADARYSKMHDYMGEDVQRYLQSRGQ